MFNCGLEHEQEGRSLGEAKRRRRLEEAAFHFSKPMKRARFTLLTIGTRHSKAAYMSSEISWWSSQDERVLGMVCIDKTDRDYFWMILLRDRIGRFRCANLVVDMKTVARAESELRLAIAEILKIDDIEKHGEQGDETNNPIDLFELATDQNPDQLHPYFKLLREEPGREPARVVFKELARWLAPTDPHLVREFQTSGFDQRLWEFYLWAAFREFFLDVEQLEAPDFRCQAPGIDFTVEATTVAPSQHGVLADHPNPKTHEETVEFLNNYMPMKFGSSLNTKFNKVNAQGLHYWEFEHSKGKPFAIAIADFHEPIGKSKIGSMTYTQSALWQYLYGSRVYWEFEGDQLIIKPDKIGEHRYKEKTIPSGFFDQPKAENISAIIFSNAGTLAKFDRMGVAAGFAAEGYGYIRSGLKYNPDPNALMGTPFTKNVLDEDYEEWWTQEVQVFHNPNAKHKLPFEWLLGATHHYFENGLLKSYAPHDSVLSSMTTVLKFVDKTDVAGVTTKN